MQVWQAARPAIEKNPYKQFAIIFHALLTPSVNAFRMRVANELPRANCMLVAHKPR